MTEKGRSRPGQKYFALGSAREPFEAWCRENAYEERMVVLAGWLALAKLSHDERVKLFRGVETAEKSGFPAGQQGGDSPSASASQRPVETTPSRSSRRAG